MAQSIHSVQSGEVIQAILINQMIQALTDLDSRVTTLTDLRQSVSDMERRLSLLEKALRLNFSPAFEPSPQFAPTSGKPMSSVTLFGRYFDFRSVVVRFVSASGTSFDTTAVSITDPMHVVFEVPANAALGKATIFVQSDFGSTTSVDTFTVIPFV
jgi:hypothetical protein